jgi:predicted nucleic acid-binding protein
VRTFLDSGVLMRAWKGEEAEAEAAGRVIEDTARRLLTSEVIRLELLPKPLYFKQKDEVAFYEEIFRRSECDRLDGALYSDAFALAERYGLAAADAFNLASAIRLQADEFVTTERPGRPMFRVKELQVVTLHAAAGSRA